MRPARGIALAVGLVLIAGGLGIGVRALYAGKAVPGTRVGSLEVGGMTARQISEAVAKKAAGVTELKYTYQGKAYAMSATDIGLEYDVEATGRDAVAAGRSNFFKPLLAALGATAPALDPHVSFNDVIVRQKLADQTAGLVQPVKNAAVVRRGTEFRITHEEPGKVVDPGGNVRTARMALAQFSGTTPLYIRESQPDIQADTLAPARAYAEQLVRKPLTIKAGEKSFTVEAPTLATWVKFVRIDQQEGVPITSQVTLMPRLDEVMDIGQADEPITDNPGRTLYATIDEAKVGEYVASIASDVETPPANARLSFTNGQLQVVGEAKDGTAIDRKAAVGTIAAAMRAPERKAQLAVVGSPAEIRRETLGSLGITSKIGSSTTYFDGSPVNRTYNIAVGAKRFDGILIKPGEDFSFNKALGDVGPETGYRPELVIKENKTAPEYGGGLCQVSTTMFRAALAAGLPITARTNHSYAVKYYAPIGMDATIYPPYPDLRFKNNTGRYILVQTRQEGAQVTFDFYGTVDGRTSTTQILYINATEADGGTAAFRYTVNGGPEPIDRVFTSTYQPHSKFPISNSLN